MKDLKANLDSVGPTTGGGLAIELCFAKNIDQKQFQDDVNRALAQERIAPVNDLHFYAEFSEDGVFISWWGYRNSYDEAEEDGETVQALPKQKIQIPWEVVVGSLLDGRLQDLVVNALSASAPSSSLTPEMFE